jgi:DNA end-binding protein Ku
LIKRKAGKFDASKFVDGYEVAVKELVEAKLQHVAIPKDEAPAPARGKVINLMDALRKSVGSDAKASTPKAAEDKKPAAKKGPTLVKSAPKKTAAKASKSASAKRKTA